MHNFACNRWAFNLLCLLPVEQPHLEPNYSSTQVQLRYSVLSTAVLRDLLKFSALNAARSYTMVFTL